MSVSVLNVGDKSVVYVDCSGKTPQQIDEVREMLQKARSLISTSAENSAYIITDLTNSIFNPELVLEFNEFVSANTTYVRDSVLVGMGDHHKVIASILRKLNNRDFHMADTLDEAKAYLTTL